MITYLLKSAIALGVFLAFYHLVLEREKMHQFNRFFLLFSIALSLVIPYISFEIVKEIPLDVTNQIAINQPIHIETAVEKTDYKLVFLWCLYAFVTLILAIRFGRNIINFRSKIECNP